MALETRRTKGHTGYARKLVPYWNRYLWLSWLAVISGAFLAVYGSTPLQVLGLIVAVVGLLGQVLGSWQLISLRRRMRI